MEWWNRLRTFLREVVAETKKVTWPSKQEVLNTTTVVIIASVIFGLYLYAWDWVFLKVVNAIFDVFS
jgi:preprotein translocase subunit SecE